LLLGRPLHDPLRHQLAAVLGASLDHQQAEQQLPAGLKPPLGLLGRHSEHLPARILGADLLEEARGCGCMPFFTGPAS
jgi:hypothetical protein